MEFIDTIESYCTADNVTHTYNNNLTYMKLKTKSDSIAVNIINLFGNNIRKLLMEEF